MPAACEWKVVNRSELHWSFKQFSRRLASVPPTLCLQGLQQRLGGSLGMLRCMARCLLVAGAKSYTHMVIALERYYGPLKNAVDAAGLEVSACGVRLAGWCQLKCLPLPASQPYPVPCQQAPLPPLALPLPFPPCNCRVRRRWWGWPALCGAPPPSAPPWPWTA